MYETLIFSNDTDEYESTITRTNDGTTEIEFFDYIVNNETNTTSSHGLFNSSDDP